MANIVHYFYYQRNLLTEMKKKLYNAAFYIWLVYLAVMLCCVQFSYLHHFMHGASSQNQSVHGMHHQSMQLVDFGMVSQPASHDHASESISQVLSQLSSVLTLLLGAVIIFALFSVLQFFENRSYVLVDYRRKRRRRFIFSLLYNQLGLRAPPALQH